MDNETTSASEANKPMTDDKKEETAVASTLPLATGGDKNMTPSEDEAAKKDIGVDESLSIKQAEDEKGYRGVRPDPTPHDHYTVAGVTAGLPTPETHPAAAMAVGSTRYAHLSHEELQASTQDEGAQAVLQNAGMA